MTTTDSSAAVVVERMWSKNPYLMLVVIVLLVPLMASFVFAYYVLQTVDVTVSKLSENVSSLSIESQKQTSLLIDIKDDLRERRIKSSN
jgi:hypothetical protein